MSQPRVAAIIVNYNGASLLPRLADCLARASSPALQVVMVDNASPDRSGEVLPVLFPKARILYNRSNVAWRAPSTRHWRLPCRPARTSCCC